jgi:hypothetical protein
MRRAVSAKTGQRNPLLIWMATAVVGYAIASGGVAVATLDECGGMGSQKHWEIIPPHWECGP